MGYVDNFYRWLDYEHDESVLSKIREEQRKEMLKDLELQHKIDVRCKKCDRVVATINDVEARSLLMDQIAITHRANCTERQA